MAMGFEDRRAKSCDLVGRDDGRDGGRASNCGNDNVLDGDVGVPGISMAREDSELCPSKLAVLRLCGVAVGEQALRLFGEADGEHGELSARSSFLK